MTKKVTPQSDLEIASTIKMKPISEIAKSVGICEEALEPYGKYKAKIDVSKLTKTTENGKVVLVTAISPTPAGEGKSTVTVGLGDALTLLGQKVMVALREPSLGPVMGLKGGATGGGYAQVLPMEEINLHFNGDFHAITSANNALSAMIDNHLFRGNKLQLDPRRITWKRVIDMNDRALRQITIGLGGPKQGVPREEGFDITVASEIMAIFCLATDLKDLKERISRIIIGYTYDGEPISVRDLAVEGALTLLLKDAFNPNLVQTIGGTAAIVHGGPFANIAHGCNSLIATNTARQLADVVITEAGFGSDLGAEKFMNIKARIGKFSPDAVVIVATVRALKMHGGISKDALKDENITAVQSGIDNLAKHIETIREFGIEPIVSLNRFVSDTEGELDAILSWCEKNAVKMALTNVWEQGGEGGIALAKEVLQVLAIENNFAPIYEIEEPIPDKIRKIVQKVYGGSDITFTDQALQQLADIEKNGWDVLPICMAKTQYSFSDDAKKMGRPKGFTIKVSAIIPKLGAGFLVCLTGDIMTMPGLPKHPAALDMDVDSNGNAIGLI